MQLTHRLRRRAEADDGFTLVEMLITVAILGVISAALVGIVFEYFKVMSSSRTRLSESTDQQFISAYWQQDVSSLGRRSFAPLDTNQLPTAQSVFVGSAGPASCGTSVGTVVVAFAWTEFTVGATDPDDAWDESPQEVAYVSVTGGGTTVLKRVRCGTAAETQTVAHNVVGTPAVTCLDHDDAVSDTPTPAKCADASTPSRVSMAFTVRDTSEPSADTSYTTTVTADRRQG